MEIQESSLPGFYCSRLLGLAPYLIRRNAKSRIDEIRRSPWLSFYSVCVMTATGEFEQRLCIIMHYFYGFTHFNVHIVSMTVRFIFVDANADVPIR